MATARGGTNFSKKLQDLAGAIAKGDAVRIGFFERAKYPDGTPVAMIAAIQDFGAPRAGIPPRPFFRNMIAKQKASWGPFLTASLKTNGYNGYQSLSELGQQVAGDLRQSIIDTNSPALKPATIRAKSGTRTMVYDPKNPATFPAKPLVDTGKMLNSIEYEVKA